MLPVKARLTLGFAAAMTIVLVLVALFVYAGASTDLLTVNDAGLRSRAEVIVAQVTAHGPVPLDVGASLIETDEAFAQIADPSGHVLTTSPIVSASPLLTASQIAAVNEPTFFNTHIASIDGVTRVLAVPVAGPVGRFVVLVGSSLQDRADQLAQLTQSLAVGMPAALLVATVFAWTLVGTALRPVERMRQDAAAIAGTSLTNRLTPTRADDELGRLAVTLNAMLDRIETAFAQQRRFVDNASHELRTPLAIARTEIDLAMSRPRDAEQLLTAVTSISAEVDHLTRLTADLLALSRAYAGRLAVSPAPTPLAEFLRDLARRHRARADITAVTISVDAPQHIVHIDRTWIREALDDVIDNALRLSPPGASITLTARCHHHTVTFTVEDDGPGFGDDLLAHAFEPFTGTEPATGHAGLGLAMVSAIAHAHGGNATAANRPGNGATVTMTVNTAL